MRPSPYGKWIISHRFQAHVWIPMLFSLVFLVLYFSGNLFLQSMVAGGFFNLPLLDVRISLTDMLKAYLLAWIFIQAMRSLVITPDVEVRALSLVVGVATIGAALSWVDGNAMANRMWSGVVGAEAQDSIVLSLLSGGWLTVEFVVVTMLTLLFFVAIPLAYGTSEKPLTQVLAPSRWMIATAVLMFVIFRIAHALLAQGWGVGGGLGTNMSLFLVVTFQYMALLYMAELNYHSVVRKEAPEKTWRMRH